MPSTIGVVGGAGFLKNVAEPTALGYRVNYIPNPSFENDLSTWQSVDGSTISRITTDAYTGSACALVQNNGNGIQLQQRQPFLGGQGTYRISCYIKLAPGNGTATYLMRHIQYATATSIPTIVAGNTALTSLSYTGNWVRISGTFTRDITADFFQIRIDTTSTTTSEAYYVDSVCVEDDLGSLGPYFDGSYNGFWTGTAHGSASGGSRYY